MTNLHRHLTSIIGIVALLSAAVVAMPAHAVPPAPRVVQLAPVVVTAHRVRVVELPPVVVVARRVTPAPTVVAARAGRSAAVSTVGRV
jgi:hypothetical protein